MNRIILLVEDNPDDVALTLRAFKRSTIGAEIVVACDGVEALDFLAGRGRFAGRDTREQPAVILLDLKLPRLSGLEVLRRLRADPNTALQPVVVLTSSNEDEDMVRSYQLGANGYVRKPVNFDEFIEAARRLGLYWLELNEAPPRIPRTP